MCTVNNTYNVFDEFARIPLSIYGTTYTMSSQSLSLFSFKNHLGFIKVHRLSSIMQNLVL